MSEMYLDIRKKHKEDVQKAIIDRGFDLSEFDFVKWASIYDRSKFIDVLKHKPSESYFTFDFTPKSAFSVRKPGLHLPKDNPQNFDIWEGQLKYLNQWLDIIKEEIEAVNLQEVLSKEKQLLQTSIPASEENDKFTEEEKKVISSKLDEIQSLLVKSLEEQKLPDTEYQAKLDQITAEIKYLKEGADRLDKKDWKNIAISTVVGLASTLALSSEARLTLATVVKSLFDFIVHSPNLLGY